MQGSSRRALFAFAAVASTIGLVACTALLGDFSTSPAGALDGAPAPALDGTAASDSSLPPSSLAISVPPAVFVRVGESVSVVVTLQGAAPTVPVSIAVSQLPVGISAASLTVAAGAKEGSLVLTAAGNAVVGARASALIAAVAGTLAAPTARLEVTVAGTTGTLDTGFPTKLPFDPTLGTISDAVVQPDGKVLLFGSFHTVANDAPNLVLRMNADGTKDATFATQAIATIASAAPAATSAVGLLAPDGKITVGWTQGANSVLNVTRLLATGALDPSWSNPNTSTASTNMPFVETVSVPLARTNDGGLLYAQRLDDKHVQFWRFTAAGAPDLTLGIMGNPGTTSAIVGLPVTSVSAAQSLFPQPDGTTLVVGDGTNNNFFVGQILSRVTGTLDADTTFGPIVAPNTAPTGWEWGNRFYQSIYESVQVGSTIYSASRENFAGCSNQDTFCVTSWNVAAADAAVGTPVCPSAKLSGLNCGDGAYRLVAGPGNTLLVAGFVVVDRVPVVTRFTLSPLAIDSSFGVEGVTKLKAASTTEAVEAPVAVLAMPDGTTLVVNKDTVSPIQRVWP